MVDVAPRVVVVVFWGATAGKPLTGLKARRELLLLLLEGLAAGMALKRTLGRTVVEREVEEALVSTTVLMSVSWMVE